MSGLIPWLALALSACVDLNPPWDLVLPIDGSVAQSPAMPALGGADGSSNGVGGASNGVGGASGGGGGTGREAPPSTGGAPGDGGASATGGNAGTGGLTGSGGASEGGAVGSGGTTMSSDTGSAGGEDAGGNPVCASDAKSDSGICWYYGAASASCAQTCQSRGGVSPQAASHIGSSAQGGSLSECTRLLSLLGLSGRVVQGTRDDGVGLGCHMFPSGGGGRTISADYYWLSSPDYSDRAAMTDVRLVCGCAQ